MAKSKSKTAKAKEDAGWRDKGPMCSNCKFFKSKVENKVGGCFGSYIEETMKRCHQNDNAVFATKKQSWCLRHQFDE